jgi:hypothetical protein
MNILEAEDMVKGLPDQVLFQYAQNPPPQIPQFLAISEVQRRQDMRQRFQSQSQGQEPTVKDQILQGGIGATGMAPEISSAPPMAPMGAAPPGAPMQQPMTGAPMGMAEGGRVPGTADPQVFRDFIRRNFSTPQGLGANIGLVGGALLGGPIGAGIGANLGTYVGQKLTPSPQPLTPFEMMKGGLRAPEGNAVSGGGGGLPYGGPTSYAGGYDRNQLIDLVNQFGDRKKPTVTVEEIPQGGGMSQGGLTPGGIVRMQQGRTVPGNEFQYLNNLRSQAIRSGDYAAVERIEKSIQAALDQNRSVARERIIGNLLPDFSGILPDQSLTERFKLNAPSRPASSAAPQQPDVQRILAKPPYSRTAQENDLLRASGVQLERSVIPREGITVPYADVVKRVIDPSGLTSFTGQILPESDRARIERPPAEAAVASAPTAANLPANFDFTAASRAVTGQAPPAAPVAIERPPVSPGGIGDINAGTAGQRTDLPPPAGRSTGDMSVMGLINEMRQPTAVSEQQQKLINLIEQQRTQGLPAQIDLSQYVQAAQQRQQEAKDEARRMAIASTLMNLGSGVMSGDPAAGLRQATQAAVSTLAEGRKEAAAEGRAAEQLQLQAAQQERNAQIQKMQFDRETVGQIANIYGDIAKSDRDRLDRAATLFITYDTSVRNNLSNAAQQQSLDNRAFLNAVESAEDRIEKSLESQLGLSQEQKDQMREMLVERAIRQYGAMIPSVDVSRVLELRRKGTKESPSQGNRPPLTTFNR